MINKLNESKMSKTASVLNEIVTKLKLKAIPQDNTIYKFSIKLSFSSIGQDKIYRKK